MAAPPSAREAYTAFAAEREDETALLASSATAAAAGSSSWRSRAALLAVLLGCVGAAATMAGLSPRAGRPARFRPATALEVKQEAAFTGQCGAMDEETDYELAPVDQEKWGMHLDHVPSAEMCCAMCQGVEQCKSWTYVKNALADGCHGQCWLKAAAPLRKVPKSGVTSGLAPPRPQLPASVAQAPVPAEPASGPGVFCFSLMVPFGCGASCPPPADTPSGHEYELIQTQYAMHASIFACDSYAVYSNRTVQVADGLATTAVDVDLTVQFGGDSYTALNSWIFIAVWKKVIDEGRHLSNKWVVKVDPDAVFFPDRLRPILAAHADAGYINNCRFGLHGPIEVLSSKALAVLERDYNASWDKKAPSQCVKQLHFGQWGEDFFLSQCLWKVHGVERELDETLMCEAHCTCNDWYWCQSGSNMVTYHPFKRPDMYKQCMANALTA